MKIFKRKYTTKKERELQYLIFILIFPIYIIYNIIYNIIKFFYYKITQNRMRIKILTKWEEDINNDLKNKGIYQKGIKAIIKNGSITLSSILPIGDISEIDTNIINKVFKKHIGNNIIIEKE